MVAELEVVAPKLSPRRALATASAMEGCRELTTLDKDRFI